jgi:hypothetical protein
VRDGLEGGQISNAEGEELHFNLHAAALPQRARGLRAGRMDADASLAASFRHLRTADIDHAIAKGWHHQMPSQIS